MSGRRGRPRKPLPMHPNRVLSQAIKKGLSTAVIIQGRIKSKITRHLYQSSLKIWRNAADRHRRSSDFQHILDAENNIRKNGLQMLFEKAAAYGNTEVQRVKSSDDTVGPLNQLFNIGGATLREFALTMYPFPNTQELPSGKMGYPQSSHGPEVVPTHAIPELDFIDCVRQHVQVLCTQCYIFDVPNRDAARYTNLFLLRVRPYLDRIYSEGQCGLKDFRSGTMLVLREIKNEIAEFYSVRGGETETVTSRLKVEEPTFSTDFFWKQIEEAKRRGVDSMVTEEVDRLLKGGSIDRDEKGWPLSCLTERDVRYIWNVALRKARKKGSQVHRQLLSQFPSFWDIRRAILNDGEVDGKDGYILCSETGVDTEVGPGRADILLLRREATSNGLRAVWRPVLLLDLKTRLGLHWSLSSSERKSDSRKKHGLPARVVAGFDIKTRSLDEIEWASIIGAIPSASMSEQVRLYADAITKSYEEIVDEPCPSIPVGTLIVDAETDLRVLRSFLRTFVIEVYESLPDAEPDFLRTVYQLVPQEDSPRAAIMIHQQELPFTSNRVSLPPVWKPPYDPLEGAYGSKRRFILNVSGASPTSSGKSAARISMYWNGLQLVREIAVAMESPDILWFDLADEFNATSLATARLHLRPRNNSEDDQYRVQSDEVRELFETITVHRLHQEIQDYIFKNGNPPNLETHFQKNRQELVVVSGWDWIQSGTPGPFRDKLNQLLATILDQIPDEESVTIIWFDSPVPGQDSSSVYSTHTLLPFYQNSPLSGEVTEIIWNLPTAPRSEIWPSDWILPFDPIAPCYDEIRVLLHQTSQGYETALTQVPNLIGWSNRFRAEISMYSAIESKFLEPEELVPDSESRSRMKILSLSLIPWILDLHSSSIMKTEIKKSIEIKSMSPGDQPQIEPTLLERLRLYGGGAQGTRAYSTVTSGRINSQRSYRAPSELKTKFLASSKTERISPTSRSTSFGQVITLSQPEFQTEVLVSEDPFNRGRLLVGMFTESTLPNDDGFVWAKIDVFRLREVLSSNSENLQIRHHAFVETEDSLWLWEKDSFDSKWSSVGNVELVSGLGGRFAFLNGIRVTPDNFEFEPFTDRFPDDFDCKARLLLERLASILEKTQRVSVKLAEDDIQCEIVFTDSTADVILQVNLLGACDVIRLLRYPITTKKSLRTSDGQLLTWNPFDDIEYGKFDSVRSLVETTAPKDVGKSINPILTDVLEPVETKLELILKHDSEVCPIITSNERQHDKCWRILTRNEDIPFIRKISSVFSGREIYGLLTTGRLRDNNNIYTIDLKLGSERDNPEFYAYHEDKWIRRLLQENDIHLKRLTPGTFIEIPEQRWTLNFSLHENILEWITVSNTTGFLLNEGTFIYTLNPTHNLHESINDFSLAISRYVDIKKITNFGDSIDLLTTQLKNYGYGENPPPCRLEVTRDENTITMDLVLSRNGSPITLVTESILLSGVSDYEEFLEVLYYRLEDGDLSEYNISNIESFLEKLQDLL